MRTIRWRALLALPILLLAACGKEPPPRPPRPSVLLVMPKFPGSMIVDTTGTEEAERQILVAPTSADAIAQFYRAVFRQSGWMVKGDRSAADVIDLYAEGGPLGGTSLWVHIERQDTLSARYTLIANTPQVTLDSIAAARARERTPGQHPDTASP